jgi:hypothetical protein
METKIYIIQNTWPEYIIDFIDGHWALTCDTSILDDCRCDLHICGCFLSNVLEHDGHTTGILNCESMPTNIRWPQ